jgi:uncharacterized membrane protein YccC
MNAANTPALTPRALTERHPVERALREAVVTMLAMLATLAGAMAIDPEPGPAVLAVVLCLSFSRSHLDRHLRGRLEAAVALPIVGLVATGVGTLLLHQPWVGAAVFVSGMFLSIWLRRFGPMAARAGSLIALPFVVILTTPYIPTRQVDPLLAAAMPVIVALLALGWVAIMHALARRLGILPPARGEVWFVAPARATPTGAMRPSPSTRMAIQMAVALAVSFVVGYVFFAERWAWIVLTAFIVNSGNRGRLEVAYKSVLRVLGAATGTAMALMVSLQIGSHDGGTVALILTAVFFGIWLRPLGYAWWALFVTLALALLQGFEGDSVQQILGLRLEEIVIGAVIGVASAWLVCPVRSTGVLRRRIADALALLADSFDPETPARHPGEWSAALIRVREVAPAFRAGRVVTRHLRPWQAADWIDALLGCGDPATVLMAHNAASGELRKAIGTARKAVREPEQLLPALRQLQGSLSAAAAEAAKIT